MMHKNISHARTVVPECWKGDDESQWERAKFDPPPPKNALTDGHQNLCRWLSGISTTKPNFIQNRFRSFVSAHEWFRAPLHKVTRLFFFLGGGFLIKTTAEMRAPILTQNTSNDAVPRKEVPFGVVRPISKVWTPIFPKTAIFGPLFQKADFFRPKTALTLDGSTVNDP